MKGRIAEYGRVWGGTKGLGSLMHESTAQSEDSICLGLDPSQRCVLQAQMGYRVGVHTGVT